MKPMLDDLELPQVQEITAYDRRMLAEHKPPGMDGSLLQNLGRRPLRVALWGIASGPEALTFVEDLETMFRAGEPVPFVADITQDAELEQVVIDDLQVQELAGTPSRYSYVVTLREFIEPIEPPDTSAVDEAISDELLSGFDDLISGLDIGLDFATGLEQFVGPLTDLLGRVQALNGTG